MTIVYSEQELKDLIDKLNQQIKDKSLHEVDRAKAKARKKGILRIIEQGYKVKKPESEWTQQEREQEQKDREEWNKLLKEKR
jgi:hypothetical protein